MRFFTNSIHYSYISCRQGLFIATWTEESARREGSVL